MHIACADLQNVDILEQWQLGNIHDLGDDRQARGFLCFQEQLDAFSAHALEGVWRGARLECAAAQDRCAGSLDALCHLDDLRFAFNRAWTSDQRQRAAADLCVADFDDRILRMEFAVRVFVWFLDAGDALDNFQRFDELNVYAGSVADKADDRVGVPLGEVELEALLFEPVGELLYLSLICASSYFDNHG